MKTVIPPPDRSEAIKQADRTYDALISVRQERSRQIALWGDQSHLTDDRWMCILAEEVGEVAHALNETDPENLREELVQVAAVAVAWIEKLNKEGR